ncbi:unnamed protein product [Urochloa humidicola]
MEGDDVVCNLKGKGVAGASSSGANGRTTTSTGGEVEVFARNVSEGDAASRCKGKGAAGASSSGAIATMTTIVGAGVEVVARNGRHVKLTGPIEYVRSHGEPYRVNGFKCYYCQMTIKSGGATRLREHLAGITQNVVSCKDVPHNVKALMKDQVACHQRARKKDYTMDFRHLPERREVLLAIRATRKKMY